jgi:cytochrome P450
MHPDELSFSSADSWKIIHGHKRASGPSFQKAPKYYVGPSGGDGGTDIITANDFDHSRVRRIFSNAFSDKALKLQESLFLVYIDKLCAKMREMYDSDPKKKFNMVSMYNFTTFDVMGDLTFGDPLGMLENTDYHPWVANMFTNFRFGSYLHTIRNYPAFERLLLNMIPKSINEKRKMHGEFTRARVDKRLEKQDARPDIWGLVLARDEELGLSQKDMYANANLFMIAGTETTATLLSGLTWHLLRNPDKLKILTSEIRTAFPKEEDITIERLQSLKYLRACVEEGLRIYPPVTNGLGRLVPPGGAEIDGHRVPEGVSVFHDSPSINRLMSC